MAILTMIRFPAKSLITGEQLEGVQNIFNERFEQFFHGSTYISGVLDKELGSAGSPLFPTVTNESGGSIDISISGGAAILRDGSIIILESALEFTILSSQVNKTLFIDFQEEWSSNIQSIQKPTGNIINVSKVQVEDEDIVSWVTYEPTSFIPGTSYSSSIALGKLIVDATAPYGYSFQGYDTTNEVTYRHVYMPVVLFPDKNYNLTPSVDRFCTLYEFLSCRGGGSRATDNPFGISTRNVENLLESFTAFIETSGVARADLSYLQISTSSIGDDTILIRSGAGVTKSGKYIGSASDITQLIDELLIVDSNGVLADPQPTLEDGNYYIYLQAILDSDELDSYRIVGASSVVTNDDIILLGLITINESGGAYTITAVSDSRKQLTLHSQEYASYSPTYPATPPGLYVLEEEHDDDTDKVSVRVRYGDEFTGEWVASNQFEMVEDHGWASGDWDDPLEDGKEPWYLYETAFSQYYRIISGVALTGGGNNYRFTLDTTVTPPGGTWDARIVGKSDFALIKASGAGDSAMSGHCGLFPGIYSDESFWVKGLEPNTNHKLFIEGYLNGFASGASDAYDHTTMAGNEDFSACRVYVNSVITGISVSTWTLLEYDTIDYDVNSDFDNGNYKFVASQAGKYLLHGHWWVSSDSGNSGEVRFDIRKNGTTLVQTVLYVDGVQQKVLLGTTVEVLTIGDEITFYGWHNTSGGALGYVGGQLYHSYCVITRLSESL